MKKDSEISEDEHRRHREKNDDAIHEYSDKVDKLIEGKGQQIQTI